MAPLLVYLFVYSLFSNDTGSTPLHLAAGQGHSAVVAYLVTLKGIAKVTLCNVTKIKLCPLKSVAVIYMYPPPFVDICCF